jgi:parvulin-like peptidyl-prolyl isomerase
VRVQDGLLARELYFRISAGEASFADLAARFSEGPEKATNGIVGPVPLTQAHPVLAEKLRIASPGVLMEPFSLAEWWLVVRLERYTPAIFDDAMAERMASELFDEWVQQEAARRLLAIVGSQSSARSA